MIRLALVLFLLAGTARAQTTAVVAVGADPGPLNPAVSTAGPLHTVADTMFSGLVLLAEDGTPRPDLALSWEVQDGPTPVWTFRLDPAARWHDGTPATSADVAYTFTEVLFRHHARARAGLAPSVAAIEVPDPQTVVFRLSRRNPAFLAQLDVTEAPILPRHIYAGTDPLVARPPVGTGPFRFVEHRRDDRVVVARAWGAGYDRLVFRIIPEPATQLAALQRGEVDLLVRVAPADVARLPADATRRQMRGGPGGSNCVMTLAFNLQRVPLAQRRAMAQAVDRPALLARLAFGQGRVATALLHSGLGGFAAPGVLDSLPLDRATARQDLGGPASLDLVTVAAFGRWAEALREDFAAIGLTLRPRLLDPTAMAQAVFARRDFDTTLVSYCHGPDPEIGARRMFDSAAIAIPFGNAAGFRDRGVDALLAEAAGTPDRGAAWREIQARAVAALPYWPLVETDFTAAWRGSVGWEPWSGRLADRAAPARP